MKIYKDEELRYFEPWSGAKHTFEVLTAEDLDYIEDLLKDMYPDGITETEVNDILWFESDWIAEMLGYEDWDVLEEIYKERKM